MTLVLLYMIVLLLLLGHLLGLARKIQYVSAPSREFRQDDGDKFSKGFIYLRTQGMLTPILDNTSLGCFRQANSAVAQNRVGELLTNGFLPLHIRGHPTLSFTNFRQESEAIYGNAK